MTRLATSRLTSADVEREPVGHWVAPASLRELLEWPTRSGVDGPALHDLTGGWHAARHGLGHAGVLFETRRVANALCAAGACRDDRIGVLCDRGARSLVLALGAMACGVAVPIDAAQPTSATDALIERHGIRVLVGDGAPASVARGARIVGAPEMDSARGDGWDAEDDRGEDAQVCETVGPDGRLWPVTYRMLRCGVVGHRVALGYGEGERLLCALPPAGVAALFDGGLYALANGVTVCIAAAPPALAAAGRSAITPLVAAAAEAGCRLLLTDAPDHAPSTSRPDDPCAPMHPARLLLVGRRAGVDISEPGLAGTITVGTWGCEATAGIYTAAPVDGDARSGSAGFPAPYCEVAIAAQGSASILRVAEPGATGRIAIRGPRVAAGPRTDDGWYLTGDTGHFDDDGYLWVDPAASGSSAQRPDPTEAGPARDHSTTHGAGAAHTEHVMPSNHSVQGTHSTHSTDSTHSTHSPHRSLSSEERR